MLPGRVTYAYSLSNVNDKLRTFRFYLRWMCVDQSDARHTMISWFLFLLICVFVSFTSHFVLSCTLHRLCLRHGGPTLPYLHLLPLLPLYLCFLPPLRSLSLPLPQYDKSFFNLKNIIILMIYCELACI
ncbi:hypothetical protein B296_00023330 [Ensete ventricosum]|uniref:Uncharacterized protein n=1 Tax=Ensete ventricosum TaxID=4639 RepID=A0A426Y692_ENSVE|nr:hypothetical protein B296_00023330 [Ensete ventricosum]